MVCLFWGVLFTAVWGGYKAVRYVRSYSRPQPSPGAVSAVTPAVSLSGAKDYVGKARAYLAAGDYASARIEAKNAVQKQPASSAAHRVLGEASLRCGMRVDAQNAFEKAAELGCADGAAQMFLARLAGFSGETDDMLRWAEAAVDVASNSVEALTLLSDVHELRGDLKAAHAMAKRAYAMAPLDTNAVVRLAAVELVTGNTAEAERLYKGLLDSDPENLASRVGGARVRLARKDFDGAVAELKRVLKVDSGNVAAVEALSSAYLEKRDFTALENLYATFTSQQPYLYPIRGQWAFVLMSAGRLNAAYDEATRLLRDNPGNIRAHLVLGELFARLNMWTVAEQHARDVIELDRRMISGQKLVARVLMSQGKNERALDELNAACKIKPNDLGASLLVAVCLQQLGRGREAVDLLKQTITAHPESPVPFVRLGEQYMRSAEYALAAKNFREALALDATNTVVLNNLAAALVQSQGATDEALGFAMRAKALSPDSPQVLDTLGWTYLQRKDYRKAAECLEAAAFAAPQDPTICLHLGSLLQVTGEADRAARYLKMVVDRSHDAEETRQAAALLKAARKPGVTQNAHE